MAGPPGDDEQIVRELREDKSSEKSRLGSWTGKDVAALPALSGMGWGRALCANGVALSRLRAGLIGRDSSAEQFPVLAGRGADDTSPGVPSISALHRTTMRAVIANTHTKSGRSSMVSLLESVERERMMMMMMMMKGVLLV